ncbi:multiheme c-type cytochrome [Novosphingobium sp. BL-8A]|uniref:multiheme c-type cytochrome n=1 Tax=Novosphingobium sp. BL-8A TaxID=3127639 RepID=UPI003756E700
MALACLAIATVAQAANYLGVASCAGSTCHGRGEGDGKVVRQDELRLWQDPSSPAGAHSRATAVLSGPRGQRIATALGLGSAASAPACLGCHATNAPAAARGERYQASDGVGCESCHGAASGWISSHYAMPASHAANLAAGMTALDRPQVRARVCLDCHYGSDKPGQFVTHAMMAAGHPRVAFELDLFSALQAHYDLDADYAKRKGRLDSVQLWAVGQAEAIRRQTRLFADPALANEGLFPQFTFFDCHSCHRPISDDPGATRKFEVNPGRPIPFGNPPFNDENMIMLSAVAATLAPAEAARFDAAARGFHAAMAKGRPQSVAAAQTLGLAAASLSDTLAARSYPGDTAFSVIAAISGKTTAPRFTDYTGSAQAVMAVDTLLNALVREGRVTVGAAAGIRADINRAYAATAAPERFDPPAFRAALGQATRAIGTLH